MKVYDIRGVEVEFPFEAYACQYSYMEKVIECLQTRGNALLESPTGTGKTLSLLCATLAWRRHYAARKSYHNFNHSSSPHINRLNNAVSFGSVPTDPEDLSVPTPKIIYSSRTHSQLSQAIGELRNTTYSARICLLGSRDQLCVHPEVSNLESSVAKQHSCNAKVIKKVCEYYNKVDSMIKASSALETDIEDLGDLQKAAMHQRFCPYFYSRKMQGKADIIFMPYNYLIDPVLRKTQEIDLKNTIIIFDEAHNLEGSCAEATSFSLTNVQLSACLEEVSKAIGILLESEENERNGSLQSTTDLKDLLTVLFMKMNDMPISTEGQTHPGTFLHTFFENNGISFSRSASFIKQVEATVNVLSKDGKKVKIHKALQLSHLHSCLKILFREEFATKILVQRNYRVHLSKEPLSQMSRTPVSWGRGQDLSDLKTINFWCFNSGETMKELVRAGVRNIILTSGTLSPLDSFAMELQIPFRTMLENPHIIQPQQVWAGVIPKGPTGVPLSSSFKTRNEVAYKAELGKLIVDLCKVIPEGLLVFFPSYTVMDACIKNWQNPMDPDNIWSQIQVQKYPVIEPRKKADFNQVISIFNNKVGECGAVLFAVCRGKVSEGIDFADSKGRAVVITGLPFLPTADPKIILKKKYLDEEIMKDAEALTSDDPEQSGPSAPQAIRLSGDEWYQQQATRAVNQAAGRVIRHRRDYGAIIFCDERFAAPRNRNQMSLWIRPHLKVYDNVEGATNSVTEFFWRAQADKSLNGKEVISVGPTEGAERNQTFYHLVRAELAQLAKEVEHSEVGEDPFLDLEKYPFAATSRPVSSNGAALFEALKTHRPTDLQGPNLALKVFAPQRVDISGARQVTKPRIALGVASNPICVEEDKPAEEPPPRKPEVKIQDEKTTQLHRKSASVFNAKLKEVLGEDVEKFRNILRDFKAKTISLEVLFFAVQGLFQQHNGPPTMLNDLKTFIPEKHGEEFDRLLEAAERERNAPPPNQAPEPDSPKVEIFEDIDVLPAAPRANNFLGRRLKSSSFDIFSGKPSKKRKLLHPDFAPRKQITSTVEFIGDDTPAKVVSLEPPRSISVITVEDDPPAPEPRGGVGAVEGSFSQLLETQQSQFQPSQIPSFLEPGAKCVICQDPPVDPHASRCGHICCLPCWETWLNTSLECPICRTRTRIKQLTKLLVSEQLEAPPQD